MSYLNQANDPRNRLAAIAGAAAIHAGLGVAVVAGLTIVGVGPLAPTYQPTVDFPTAPPPTPTPTPTAAIDTMLPTPPAPLPPIPIPQPNGPERTVFDAADTVLPEVTLRPDAGQAALPDPPRPSPSFTPRRAAPSNAPARWITNEDYPARPLNDGIEGMVGYRLIVGSNGRVNACEISASSGNRALDEATCRLITRRARFEPATDETGARTVGSYTGTVRWQIPD